MTPSHSHRSAALVTLFALALAACEGAKDQEPTPYLDVLQLLPAAASLDVGDSAQLGALRLRAGEATNVTADVDWSSDDESIVAVSYDPEKGALVEAIGPGTAHVTARDGDGSATAEIVVRASVRSIELDKVLFELPKGGEAKLGAVMITSLGTKRELDGPSAWGSSDLDVATVDGDGLVSAVEVGDAVITLTRGAATATQRVHVRDWTLESIDAVSVYGKTLPFGQRSPIQVRATFTDDHTADVSSLFTLASDEDSAALAASSMDPLVTIEGATVIAGSREGMVGVSGTGRAGSIVDGQSFTIGFEVLDAALAALVLELPTALSLGGDPAVARITGSYGFGFVFETAATLSATPEGLVAIDSSNGTIVALAAGTTTITASVSIDDGDEDATSARKVEVSQDVEVVEDGVSELTVELTSSSDDDAIEVDQTTSLSAAARFGAAGPIDATELAVWSSSDESIAVVSNVRSGTATGVGAGQATITASYRGATADFELTVVAAAGSE